MDANGQISQPIRARQVRISCVIFARIDTICYRRLFFEGLISDGCSRARGGTDFPVSAVKTKCDAKKITKFQGLAAWVASTRGAQWGHIVNVLSPKRSETYREREDVLIALILIIVDFNTSPLLRRFFPYHAEPKPNFFLVLAH